MKGKTEMTMTLVRKATEEETAIYYKLEELTKDIEEEDYVDLLDYISLYVCEKKNFEEVEEWAKKLGVTVEELLTWWYCDTDE